jgi:hypothetical protein
MDSNGKLLVKIEEVKHNEKQFHKITATTENKSSVTIHPGLRELIGGETELFFEGIIAQSDGKGISAYTTYKKLLCNRKDDIYTQIIGVLELLDNQDINIAGIKSAKSEKVFGKSISLAKNFIPPELFVMGLNPLGMIENLAASNVHNKSNDEYLILADNLIVVLTRLAEKLSTVRVKQKKIRLAVANDTGNIK